MTNNKTTEFDPCPLLCYKSQTKVNLVDKQILLYSFEFHTQQILAFLWLCITLVIKNIYLYLVNFV